VALLSSYNDSYTVVVAKVAWHQWWHWWPCDARALCLLKPWWAVLGSHYPSTMRTNYQNTSRCCTT